ncbi:hypothetical protein X975_16657, partial [Stegodyphus mimosarum]
LSPVLCSFAPTTEKFPVRTIFRNCFKANSQLVFFFSSSYCYHPCLSLWILTLGCVSEKPFYLLCGGFLEASNYRR